MTQYYGNVADEKNISFQSKLWDLIVQVAVNIQVIISSCKSVFKGLWGILKSSSAEGPNDNGAILIKIYTPMEDFVLTSADWWKGIFCRLLNQS